jgi:hypothetical protein
MLILVSVCMPDMHWLCFHVPAVLVVPQKMLELGVTLRARLS